MKDSPNVTFFIQTEVSKETSEHPDLVFQQLIRAAGRELAFNTINVYQKAEILRKEANILESRMKVDPRNEPMERPY